MNKKQVDGFSKKNKLEKMFFGWNAHVCFSFLSRSLKCQTRVLAQLRGDEFVCLLLTVKRRDFSERLLIRDRFRRTNEGGKRKETSNDLSSYRDAGTFV